jgi:glutathione S-transferase
MIIVHHLEKSRSQRVLWLLEELGVPYEVVHYKRHPQTLLAPPELRAIHPLGKSPVIVDGGHTIAETGAIIEYLVEAYGGGRLLPPPGTPERLAYRYWLHYAEGSAMPPLLLKLIFSRMPRGVPAFIRPVARMIAATAQTRMIDPQLANHRRYWNETLARTPWFAGQEMTAADVQMSFPVEAAAGRVGLDDAPAVRDWLDRVHARPAYQRALKTGGPFDLVR